MGLFSRREKRNGTDAQANTKLADFIRGTDLDEGGGISVTEESALTTSAVYACVKVIAESIASLPLRLIREDKGVRTRARGHPLYGVLHDLANEETASLNFREAMLASLLLWGNAYARIERKAGHVTALWFLKPERMDVKRDRDTGRVVYRYTAEDTGQITEFNAQEIFHVLGFSLDGIKGISPIRQARQTIELTMATEEYGAKFFSNGARPGGVLETAGVVKDPDRLRSSWNAQFQGSRNSHRIAVLEEGIKYHTIGILPDEAQFLETRKFQLAEICRLFRVPPHMIADLDRATFSNIEHQAIEFVQHTLRPWIVRYEQAVFKCLLSKEERQIYYARFNVDGLLRGDYQSRMQGYAIGRQNGWLSANDIRELEDMNPIEGGDVYLVNGNMTAADAKATPQTALNAPQSAKDGGTDKEPTENKSPPVTATKKKNKKKEDSESDDTT
jgi:HK97 family phage portal protein